MASLAAVSAPCPPPVAPAASTPPAAPATAPPAAPEPAPSADRPAGPSAAQTGALVVKLEPCRAGRFSAAELEALAVLGVAAQYLVIEEGGAEYTVHADALGAAARHLRGLGAAPGGVAHTVDALYVPEYVAAGAATAGDRAAYRLAGEETVLVKPPLGGARWAPVSRALKASAPGAGAPERGPLMRVHAPGGVRLPAVAAEPEYPAESWPFLIALGRIAGVGYTKVTPSGGGERLVRADALTEAFRENPAWLGAR